MKTKLSMASIVTALLFQVMQANSAVNTDSNIVKKESSRKSQQRKTQMEEESKPLTDAEKINEIKGQLSSLVNDWYYIQKRLPASESINDKEIFFLKAQEYFKKDIHNNLMNSKGENE